MATKRSLRNEDMVEEKRSKTAYTKQFRGHIGGDKFLATSKYNKMESVHMRAYSSDESGRLYPTKSGVSFDIPSWLLFANEIPNIDQVIRLHGVDSDIVLKQCIGDYIYVTVNANKPFVNIRKLIIPKGHTKAIPTKDGLCMTFKQWDSFLH